MKLKNIYLIRSLGILLIIAAAFLAVVLNSGIYNIIQMQRLYLTAGLFACALGYFEIADIVKLGFGITRFSIYKRFTLIVAAIDMIMFLLSLVFVIFSKLADPGISMLYFFDYRLIIYFTLTIYFLSQFGMFFGNIKIPEYLKLIIIAIVIIFIAYFININNKFLINSLLILFSVGLSIVNYTLIKNIKLEINL